MTQVPHSQIIAVPHDGRTTTSENLLNTERTKRLNRGPNLRNTTEERVGDETWRHKLPHALWIIVIVKSCCSQSL